MNRSDEFRKLLASAFDVDELRRFVRFGPDGAMLASELPSGSVSLAELAVAVAMLFERVRLVTDAAFWRHFAAERERWAADIEVVRKLYVGAGAPAMPPLAAPEDLLDALVVGGFFREVARLFDVQRVMNLLRHVGVDASNFPPIGTPTPKAWWESVVGELRYGAVSDPQAVARALVLETLEHYPANPVLVRAGELVR